jgi:hypothetical protein
MNAGHELERKNKVPAILPLAINNERMRIAMLKIISTLLRGTVAEIEETVLDANAIRLLEQQIRDAAAGLEQARRELACVMAHQSSES